MIKPSGVLVLLISVLVQAPSALAQTTGSTTGAIAGRVADASGAVLAGVTVTATGDVLLAPLATHSIEDGSYHLPAVPSGRHRLTFVLPGFDTAAHEGIVVSLGVTTTVDVTLSPASLRETVTVEGGAAVVDRRASMIATVFDGDELERLPGSRTMAAILAAAPAVQLTRFDVGGSTAFAAGPFSVYGTSGYNRPTIEGIVVSGLNPLGFALDYGTFADVSVGAGAYGPEWPSPGLHLQFVTRSGGNRYAGTVYAAHEHGAWQGHNIDADQAARGAPVADGLPARDANRLGQYRDVNGDVGGYLRKDRLWWYASARDHGASARQVSFPAASIDTRVTSATGKMTWRVGDGHRIVGFAHSGRSRQPIRLDGFLRPATARNTSVESTIDQLATGLVWKAEWNAIVGREVYVEVRAGQFEARRAERPNGSSPRVEDLLRPDVTGGNRDWRQELGHDQVHGSLSYFRDGWAGRHELKAGVQVLRTMAAEDWLRAYPGDVLHVTQNGIPREVYFFQAPSRSESGQWWHAAYVADRWEVHDRLTFNLGVRLDALRIFLPEQAHPAGRFNATPQSFEAVPNVAGWNAIAPRVAASLDLRGDGRTILKTSYGLHWLPPTSDLGFNVNPNGRVWWQRFKWADANADGLWQAGEEFDLQETRGGEAGESIDPRLELAYIREVTARIEHDARAGLLIGSGLVWRGERQQGGRQRASWPFEAFSVPVTLRDPGPDAVAGTSDDGADIQVVELRPDLLGRSRIVVRNAPYADSDYLTWEVLARRRFSGRWSAFASFAHTWNRDHASGYFGQPVRANEFPATPNDLIGTDPRGRHAYRDWSVKVHGTYAGPWGLFVTPFLRHQSGQAFGRTLVARLNYGTIRVLTEPVGTRRQDHITLADVRVEKTFMLGSDRLTMFVEVFNVLNANPEQNIDWQTGADFLRPLAIVPPRIARVGFRFDW